MEYAEVFKRDITGIHYNFKLFLEDGVNIAAFFYTQSPTSIAADDESGVSAWRLQPSNAFAVG
jgi:hypothetical protein